jgi:hypothetical protein
MYNFISLSGGDRECHLWKLNLITQLLMREQETGQRQQQLDFGAPL